MRRRFKLTILSQSSPPDFDLAAALEENSSPFGSFSLLRGQVAQEPLRILHSTLERPGRVPLILDSSLTETALQGTFDPSPNEDAAPFAQSI
jgi:hypothetical protein